MNGQEILSVKCVCQLWEGKYIICNSVVLSKCTSLDGCLGKIINLETGCWKNCSVSLAVSSRKPSIAAAPPPKQKKIVKIQTYF